MKLLEAEPQPAPGAPGEPPVAAAPPAPRTCSTCGAPLAAEQDWCLVCGTAAKSAFGRRPGWRAIVGILALTVLLLVGAGAASYAALTDDPAPQQPIAQAPPVQQPDAVEPTPEQPPPVAEQPTTEEPPPVQEEIPTVEVPPAPVEPIPNPQPLPPITDPGTAPGEGGGPVTTPGGEGTPAQDDRTPIELATDAGAVYDPYGRATATGDPHRAIDANPSTSWYVDPKDPALIGVGYLIDLGKVRTVNGLDLSTKTPGFKLELYATDQTEVPPDILDTRWAHVRDLSDVGARDPDKPDDVEGKERISFAGDTAKYRYVLLWFTQPPTDGPRLRITDLELFR